MDVPRQGEVSVTGASDLAPRAMSLSWAKLSAPLGQDDWPDWIDSARSPHSSYGDLGGLLRSFADAQNLSLRMMDDTGLRPTGAAAPHGG